MFLAGLAKDEIRIACGLVHAFITTFTFICPFSLIHRVAGSELCKQLSKGGGCVPSLTKIATNVTMSVTKGMRCVICHYMLPLVQGVRKITRATDC